MTTDGITIGDIAHPGHELSGALTCAEVDRLLAADPTLTSLIIRDTAGSLGLLDRGEFEYRMSGARGFGRWLNASRPVEEAIDVSETLTLEATLSLDGAYRAMLDRRGPRRFHDILVIGGQQASTVRADTLLEAVARIHEREALRDALTGLGNRVLLIQRVTEALRERSEEVALLFIDIDRFKVVNDSLGHDAGDSLLVQFGQRLRECVGPNGIPTRLGGDEFAVLVTDPSGEVAPAIGARLVDALGKPFAISDQFVVMTASIGIALADATDTTAALLRKADLAMYQAKGSGGGRFLYFRGDLERVAHERLETEVWLREALAGSGALKVYYQPIVSLADGQLVGVEALIRGFSPTRGALAPDDFLGVAEETGLITALDFCVLREPCAQLRRWQSRGRGTPSLRMSVNMSARHFERIAMSREVLSVIRATGIDPTHLQLEITEGTMLRSPQQAVASLLRREH